jgi:serine/threonine protein phosphatase PrpC
MIVYQFQQASIEHPDRCEDAILISSNVGHAPVFAIIDGMGGHKHQLADGQILTGRDAALLIHDVLIEDFEHFELNASADPDSDTEKQLLAGISRAHAKLFSELNGGEGLTLRERLGAVLTAVVVCEEGKRLLVAQVGDSRAYVYTDDELIQLCPDEDNIEHLVRRQGLSARDAEKISAVLNTYDGVNEPNIEGTITLGGQVFDLYMAWRWFLVGNQALNIPASNVVINSMGTHQEDPVAEKSRIEIGAGDVLLMCSDGLYKNLSEAEIINGLQNTEDPAKVLGEAALARSQDKSNSRKNPDDISVIVVKF